MGPTPSPASPAPAPHPVNPPPRGWWSRNWKWFVPMGCLTFIVAGIAFVAAIVLLVFGAMKSSDAYKGALAQAKASPAVTEALGTPIRDGWFVSGKTNVEGSGGEANLSIPISGPKGKGTLYVVATKVAGKWKYTTLEVEIEGNENRIDLLGDSTPDEQ